MEQEKTYEQLEEANKNLQARLEEQLEKTKHYATKAEKAEKELTRYRLKSDLLQNTIVDQLKNIVGTITLAEM